MQGDYIRIKRFDEKTGQLVEEFHDLSAANFSSDTEPVESIDSLIHSTDTESTEVTANTYQPSIEELTVEIKFYLGQMAQSGLEVGKRLILAKDLVPHGEWKNWLKDNFNLSYPTATKFMKIAERFSNVASMQLLDISTFKPTQLIAMLALPEGEEQKFIAEKAAEGSPVADMSVRQLKDEIVEWKNRYKQIQQTILINNEEHERQLADKDSKIQELTISSVSQIPADYEVTKKENSELKLQNQQLQKKLDETPIEIQVQEPADYEDLKHQLAVAKADKVKKILDSCKNFLQAEDFAESIRSYVNTNPANVNENIDTLSKFIAALKEVNHTD